MKYSERRHDIDWLRVIAIGLLIIYHIAIVFQPWGVFIGFIQSNDPLEGLWPLMSMLNVWRIPLLFMVSGMGVGFAMQRRSLKMLVAERIRRILIPFIFGTLVIAPLHVFLWQDYYSQDFRYTLHPGHLWFLGNIMLYVIIFSPLFFLIQKKREHKPVKRFINMISTPWGILTISGLFLIEYILVKPEAFEIYAMTRHGFFIGMLTFVCGFLFILAGEGLWTALRRYRWYFLLAASLLYLERIWFSGLNLPEELVAIESSFWIFCILGMGNRYLNRPSETLGYLSGAAYPVYILHMVFLYIGSAIILPTNLSASTKFLFITVFTISTGIISYEGLRRIPVIGMLFGLRARQKYRAGMAVSIPIKQEILAK